MAVTYHQKTINLPQLLQYCVVVVIPGRRCLGACWFFGKVFLAANNNAIQHPSLRFCTSKTNRTAPCGIHKTNDYVTARCGRSPLSSATPSASCGCGWMVMVVANARAGTRNANDNIGNCKKVPLCRSVAWWLFNYHSNSVGPVPFSFSGHPEEQCRRESGINCTALTVFRCK